MNIGRTLRRITRRAPRISVVRLYGAIGLPGRGPSGLSDEGVGEAVERAFDARPVAVALAVNSPGGSPTQSALIAARIRRKAQEKRVPVFAFCEDVAASGGYWLACAGDEIWVDANSLIGSIGVIYAGFGFTDALGRLGVERRVHTAGERKVMLDPFQPERTEDVERLLDLQRDIHDNFIAHVRARRGHRLAEADLFQGDVWTGGRAVELGLADGLGHLRAVMQAKFGEEAVFREFQPKRGLLQRIGLPGGSELAGETAAALEARLMWSRYGV
ncbi:MAG: S49 family peptidase [Pseudomonadota bacterium]